MLVMHAVAGILLVVEMICCAIQPPLSHHVMIAETLVVVLATMAFLGEGSFALPALALEAGLVIILRARGVISPPLWVTPVDLTGKVAIVTGGYSGVGMETARLLAAWNATVILACRDNARASQMAEQLQTSLPAGSSGKVVAWELNLEDLASVRAFAERFLASSMPLHILVNNAGVRYHDLEVTGDGIELHYQVNHLSHFLLTMQLLPRMESSKPARIVHVSSSAHAFGAVEQHVYGAEKPNTDPRLFRERMKSVEGVYGDTKLMQVLFSNRLDAALSRRGSAGFGRVTSNVVHPGFVATNFGHRDRRWLQTILVLLRPILARDALQGALTQVFAATSPPLEGQGGLYLDNCKAVAAAPHAAEREVQEWLWKASVELTKLPSSLDLSA